MQLISASIRSLSAFSQSVRISLVESLYRPTPRNADEPLLGNVRRNASVSSTGCLSLRGRALLNASWVKNICRNVYKSLFLRNRLFSNFDTLPFCSLLLHYYFSTSWQEPFCAPRHRPHDSYDSFFLGGTHKKLRGRKILWPVLRHCTLSALCWSDWWCRSLSGPLFASVISQSEEVHAFWKHRSRRFEEHLETL